MSWLYSQVLVEEFSGDISWDGEPSALWNGTPTQLHLPRLLTLCDIGSRIRLSLTGEAGSLLTTDE